MKDSDEEIVAEEDAEMGPAALKRLREKLAACVKEKQEYLDGWQRAKADYVNGMRRLEEDSKAARDQGIARAVEAIIPTLDSIDHARRAGELSKDLGPIAKQISMAVAGLGVTPFGEEYIGKHPDPALHEVLSEQTVDKQEQEGVIAEVLQRGWKMKEKVIRPAQVSVGVFKK